MVRVREGKSGHALRHHNTRVDGAQDRRARCGMQAARLAVEDVVEALALELACEGLEGLSGGIRVKR